VQLWLIRHPPPAVAEGMCYGVTDLALAEPPHARAAALAPRLPKAPVLASPLRRCHQFAAALAEASGTELQVDHRLREMDFGAWEMQPWKELQRSELDAWAASPMAYRGHGGEAVQDLMDRARAFVSGLPEVPAVVAVTHAGIMKCILGNLLNLPREAWFELHFDYGTVTRLDRENGVWRLIWQNTADV
jgi:alpha-ribazole phosphatase